MLSFELFLSFYISQFSVCFNLIANSADDITLLLQVRGSIKPLLIAINALSDETIRGNRTMLRGNDTTWERISKIRQTYKDAHN